MKVNRSLVFVSILGVGCLGMATLIRAQESGYDTPEGVAEYITSNPASRFRVQPASKRDPMERLVESAYLRSSDESQDGVTGEGMTADRDSWRQTRIQLAAAIREKDNAALLSLLESPFGEDGALDGLLIEGARALGRSPDARHLERARGRLVDFLEHELKRDSTGRAATGSLIHIAEAFVDVPGEESASELFLLLEDQSLARSIRSAAALSLAKLGASGLKVSVQAFRDQLRASIERQEVSQDEEPFVRDALAEMTSLLARL